MKPSLGQPPISIESDPISLSLHVRNHRAPSRPRLGSADEDGASSASSRSEFEQLAHALARLLAAWWRQYLQTDVGEDKGAGHAQSNTGGER